MYTYKAPLRDFEFTYFELFGYEQHLQGFPAFAELSKDVIMTIAAENANFCQDVLAPLNQSGDTEGCHWEDGEVRTPGGFKDAYRQYIAAGWTGMAYDVVYGGQGLPESLTYITGEISGSANWSWYTYPGLAHGAKNTLLAHGTDEQKQTYLTRLISGEWTATMCLTEAHCGTDLGLLRTKAEPNPDGSYAITGTKIFITVGDHDLVPNIVHVVLARLPGAPGGTRGISLFLVPKFNVEQGEVGERNAVSCGSIEHKMGIKASATCVLHFEHARGFLLGEPHKGLNAMFVFMNTARLGAAMQGVCHAELGLQKSTGYALDRLQMRSLTGVKNPDGVADPIIAHPDVRRMLLTQKAIAEGGRMLIAYCSLLVDHADHNANPQQAKDAQDRLSFLTPIAKAFLTESGFESANLALQCFGGHGYIKEWGVEQNLRDSRIAMLYEGTTGIQALDLLGRKVLAHQGKLMAPIVEEIARFCSDHPGEPMATEIARKLRQWKELTADIAVAAAASPDEMGAASVDYLMYAGYVLLAYFWAKAAIRSRQAIAAGTGDARFYQAKIQSADFYFARLLPRTESLAITMRAGAACLMDMHADAFLLQL